MNFKISILTCATEERLVAYQGKKSVRNFLATHFKLICPRNQVPWCGN